MTRHPRPESSAQESSQKAIDENDGGAMAEKAGGKEDVPSAFAEISSPENRDVFSVRAALKAFAHVKAS